MLISELEAKLKMIKEERGDLPVCTITEWELSGYRFLDAGDFTIETIHDPVSGESFEAVHVNA